MPARTLMSMQESENLGLQEEDDQGNEQTEIKLVEFGSERALPISAAPTDSSYYTNAQKYWTSLPPTLDTMLGGFNNTRLPRVEIAGSKSFISHPLIKRRLVASSYAYAADCGAGIGRITKNLLSKTFAKTDLIEPIESFNKDVMEGEYLRPEREAGKIGQVFSMGLQEFTPEKGKYSIIWNQWCLGHLTDHDLVEYFKRCKEGLSVDGGVILVKENITFGEDHFDGVDSSCTRTEKSFRAIFSRAGLRILHSATQHGLPEGLLLVKMFALIDDTQQADSEAHSEIDEIEI